MKLLHATDRRNLPGIRRAGLLASLASGRMQAVWGVHTKYQDAAILHAATKRGVPLKDIVVLVLDVPSGWVKKFSHPGFYYVPRDVPAERIKVYGRVNIVKG